MSFSRVMLSNSTRMMTINSFRSSLQSNTFSISPLMNTMMNKSFSHSTFNRSITNSKCSHSNRNCICSMMASSILKRSFATQPPSNESASTQSPPSRAISSPDVEYYFNTPISKSEYETENSTKSNLHTINVLFVVATPIAIILSPGWITGILNYALTVGIPYHMYYGLKVVSEDYVPRHLQSATRVGILLLTAFTIVGLLKITLCGAGLIETTKSLWVEPGLKQKSIK